MSHDLTEEPPTFDELYGDDEDQTEDSLKGWEQLAENAEERLEEMEELPSPEEAELGELCRTKTITEMTEELESDVEEMEELPTTEEAELGELSQTPEGVENIEGGEL